MTNRQDLQNDADAPRLDSVVARVRGEYSEMPGLQLTCAQAGRLWHLHVSTCEKLLEQLVEEGFLCKTDKGKYVATPTIRRRT
jgi:Nse1 non-SMC component of SMC5-6 complex